MAVGFWAAQISLQVCDGIGQSHREMGILGGLNMDTTGLSLPSKPVIENGIKKWKRETGDRTYNASTLDFSARLCIPEQSSCFSLLQKAKGGHNTCGSC